MTTVFGCFQSRLMARMLSGIRAPAVWLAAALAATAVPASAARTGQLVPPKADILSVELQRRPMQTVRYVGASVRPPHQVSSGTTQSEKIEIEWFAHSPGIPPGALVMLETTAKRQPTVKNHIYRTTSKSAGNQTTRFEIPPEQTRAAGPIEEWRVRIVWRGRALATRTSSGWDAARRAAP
jgi:hypothetical protein